MMPLYDFKCDAGHVFELFVSLENFHKEQYCSCGAVARRVITAPMFQVEHVEYTCPITDRPILSKKAHEENLRIHGCRVLESGETEEYKSNLKKENDQFDKMIETTVEKEFDKMPSDKKEKLTNELLSGATLEYERK